MNRLQKILLTLNVFLASAAALAVPGQLAHDPATPGDVVGDVGFAIRYAKTSQWVMLSLAVSQVLIYIVKRIDAKLENKKMQKYGSLIVLGLSAVCSVLGAKAGNLTWGEALIVFMTTGAPKFVNDAIDEFKGLSNV